MWVTSTLTCYCLTSVTALGHYASPRPPSSLTGSCRKIDMAGECGLVDMPDLALALMLGSTFLLRRQLISIVHDLLFIPTFQAAAAADLLE